MMQEVCVSLDFACYACYDPVHVKLKCEGPGLSTYEPKATVCVPCPLCGSVIEVLFDPSGAVHRVASGQPRRFPPEPSLN